MPKIIVSPKISIGYRTTISRAVCEELGVEIGERITLIRLDDGNIVLCNANEAVKAESRSIQC